MEQAKPKQFKLAPRPQASQKQLQVKQTQVITNMYPFKFKEFKGLYIYSINIYEIQKNSNKVEIEKDARKLTREILQLAQKQMQEIVGPHITRGLNLIAFKDSEQQMNTIQVKFNKQDFEIQFACTGNQVNVDDLDYYNGTGNKVTQAINFMIKNVFQQDLKFQEKGRMARFFDPESWKENRVMDQRNNKDLRINVGKGYLSSAQILENNRLYLLLDSCSKIVREETALEFIKKCKSQQEIEEKLVGFSVMSGYGNQRNHIVLGVDFKKNPQSTFEHQGQQMTYIQYYKDRYKKQIKDKEQPLIEARIRINKDGERAIQDIHLIPELVRMTGLPDELLANGSAMREIAKYTSQAPEENQKQIHQTVQKVGESMKKFGMELQTQEIPRVQAQILRTPNIVIGKNKDQPVQFSKNGDMTFNIMSKDRQKGGVISPINLRQDEWFIIYPSQVKDQMNLFLDELFKNCKSYGINLDEPNCVSVDRNDKFNTWENVIEDELAYIEEKGKSCKVVISILPTKNSPLYSQLKNYFYSKKGIIHQNLCAENFKQGKKGTGSIAANILIQINAKTGNALWYMDKLASIKPKSMIIGIDVYHHSKNKSCVGFVASCDPRFSKYNAQLTIRKGNYEEFLDNMKQLVTNAIRNFYMETNKKFLPEQIIIFRDGVGESQIPIVSEFEVKAVYDAFQNENIIKANGNKEYAPEFIFSVINKQINQKFYNETNQGLKNPEPGTLINNTVTKKGYNFFLVNHRGTQGTQKATYYQVIENNSKTTEEDFYHFCYWQSFNYFNWKGPIRVPGCVQYAHKLAYMGGDVLKQDTIHKNIANKLFYL